MHLPPIECNIHVHAQAIRRNSAPFTRCEFDQKPEKKYFLFGSAYCTNIY